MEYGFDVAMGGFQSAVKTTSKNEKYIIVY